MRDKDVSKIDHILEAAFEVFSQNPGASLADVAKQAGVGRATLHRHFAGRDDLMIALTLTAAKELDAAVEEATANCQTYTEGLEAGLQAILPLAARHMFLSTEPASQDPRVTEVYATQTRDLAHDIDMAKAEGTFDPHVPTEWIVQAYENLIYAGWATVVAGDATPKQAAALAWRTLTKGTCP
ncbi:TetR/AcrR family transcriptional regulator [uncultured Tateyamaria sp.]|uniref:TetR/AcrR family transcriptional regulator n=1 Tax=uncultured Tateyamaria sp. TaxID=455651 RepID=UPI002604FD16|nr:TetR/AcrR family transcriptional regulator [uncultured Tateyamaria sp.]